MPSDLVELYRAKRTINGADSVAPPYVNPRVLIYVKMSQGDSAFFAAFGGGNGSDENIQSKTHEQILAEIDAMSPQDAQALLSHYVSCDICPEKAITVFDI